jgi:MFS family permease
MRMVLAASLDYIPFKKCFGFILGVQLFSITFLLPALNYKWLYFIIVVLSLICEGAMGVVLPTITIRYFKDTRGHEVHSFMYAAFGVASISSGLVVGFFGYDLGFTGMIIICWILCCISCTLTYLFDDSKTYDYRKAVR